MEKTLIEPREKSAARAIEQPGDSGRAELSLAKIGSYRKICPYDRPVWSEKLSVKPTHRVKVSNCY